MKIHDLQPSPGAHRRSRRVARGIAGKGGKTAGRGMKGQKARSKIRVGFEGGQMPLHRRLPKLRGFNNPFRVEYQAVNLDTIEATGLDELLRDLEADTGSLELKFGYKRDLVLGEGEGAFAFRGTADRVDRDGQRIAIVDYKSSVGATDKAVKEAKVQEDLQLPLYALALEALATDAGKPVEAADRTIGIRERLDQFIAPLDWRIRWKRLGQEGSIAGWLLDVGARSIGHGSAIPVCACFVQIS